MDFFNKAKEAAEKYTGGDSSSSNNKKKNSDMESLFTKAQVVAEKYHAKEKATEYAQKRVATRNVNQKDKSTAIKAMEAAEDFLAKQGQPKHHETGEKTDNQMGDVLAKAKDAAAKYSKKH